ncbi:PREDICTED: kinesin-like protein KIF13B, partial [Galeopterus variegatus]|uniref:Kinesin-like protein KIF13B n=1 Tax=Galeopterus variegatus TaxID=482537 RepID=A0ABM0Q307_GALVR
MWLELICPPAEAGPFPIRAEVSHMALTLLLSRVPPFPQAQREGVGPGPAMLVRPMAPTIKICDPPAKAPSPPPIVAVTPASEGQDGPPSPLSEASSGYFSHSVSTATLSDALVPSLDAMAPAGSQNPGSPPAPLCQAALEAESLFPPVASCAQLQGPSSHLSPPVPTEPAAQPPMPAPQLEAPIQHPRGEALLVPRQLGRPLAQANAAPSSDLPPDLQCQAPAPTSPFRIRKVRTSELKSFTRMLGGGSGCSPGAQGEPLASGGLDDRIRKVRTSELKSFTRMLGGGSGCSPGAQ